MKTKMKLLFPVSIILILLALQVSTSSAEYSWQTVTTVYFDDLGPVLGALDYNGTHIQSIDMITGNMTIIDTNLSTVLDTQRIVYPLDNGTNLFPFLFGFTNAKGFIFGTNWDNQTIYLMDQNNFSIIEEYNHEVFIADLCYDEEYDLFVVPVFSEQCIAVYNGTFFNGSLSSLEIGSFDSPAFIGAYFFPAGTPPTFISCYKGEYLVFEYRSGLWNHFTIDFEMNDLIMIPDQWAKIGFESYGWAINDAAIVNMTCVYFTCPNSNKIRLYTGEEVIPTTTTTTTTTTSETDSQTGTTSGINPLYSSGLQTDLIFWGMLALTGTLSVYRKKKRGC